MENYFKGFVWLGIILLAFVPTSLQAQFTCTINGYFPKSWEGKQAMVVVKPLHQKPIIDTMTVVNRNVAFTVQLIEPSPAYLWIEGNADDIQFFIDSPRIDIGIDGGATGQHVLTGSASSELWPQQISMLNKIRESQPDLRMDAFAALQAGDTLTAVKLEQVADSLRMANDNLIVNLIQNNPSLTSSWYLFASNSFSYAQTLRLFGGLSAVSAYPSYQKIKEKLARKQLGNTTPDFNLPSSSGSSITLSTLESNFILVDFSSNYEFACKKRHDELKKLYKTYQPIGLEIVTVSFGFDKQVGVESAPQERLPWIQVLDFIGPSSMMETFGIERLPDNLLLDANKIMIGRDMSVQELDLKLNQLLRK